MRTLESKTVDGTKLELRKLSDGRYSILEDGTRIIEPFRDKDDAYKYYQNTIADFRRRANERGPNLAFGGGGGAPMMPDFSGGAGGMPMIPGMGTRDDDDDDDDRGFYIPGL